MAISFPVLRTVCFAFPVRLVVLAALALLVPSAALRAQYDDCEQLRRQLAAGNRGDPGRAAQFSRAAQRQRAELARTQAYADQIGCGSQPFSIFGSDTPPQCDTIEGQIGRMTNNLSSLESQTAALQGSDPAQQQALLGRYQAFCSTNQPALSDALGDPMGSGFDEGGQDQSPPESARVGGGKAVCVRTCDGGFFPLGYSGGQNTLEGMQSLCTALCPNSEAKLYTVADTDNIGAAVSADGRPYTELANAFRFQKTFDSTCTCKPPNKSWVDALADAERLLDKGGNTDVTVTAKMSEDMARPTTAVAPAPKRKNSKAERKAALDSAQVVAEGALGAVGVQAPTASKESAGIASNLDGSTSTVRTGEGAVRTQVGPDGLKRRVRTIAPRL